MKKILKVLLPSVLMTVLIFGIAFGANTFPTSLNTWADGDVIESDWANQLESKIGIDGSTDTDSLDYKVKKGGMGIVTPDGANHTCISVTQNDTTNNPVAETITNTGTGDSLQIDITDFVVKADGKVGIGISPTEELHLYKASGFLNFLIEGYDAVMSIKKTDDTRDIGYILKNVAGTTLMRIYISSTFSHIVSSHGPFCINQQANEDMIFKTNNTEHIRIYAGGLTAFNADSIKIITSQTPASGAACSAGEIAWDANYMYVCTASTVWGRSALTTGY